MVANARYKILTGAAVLALVLVVADSIVAETNRSAQVEVNNRQQFINQGIELSRVNQALVRAIAVAAVKNQDSQLGKVLADQGIEIRSTPSATAAPFSAPSGAAGRSTSEAHK